MFRIRRISICVWRYVFLLVMKFSTTTQKRNLHSLRSHAQRYYVGIWGPHCVILQSHRLPGGAAYIYILTKIIGSRGEYPHHTVQ